MDPFKTDPEELDVTSPDMYERMAKKAAKRWESLYIGSAEKTTYEFKGLEHFIKTGDSIEFTHKVTFE